MEENNEEIQAKQTLLQTEIIDKNYDKTAFINFCLSKKEKRQQYRGAKAVDKTCRNHGSDDWEKDNRLYRVNRLEEKAKQDIETVED